MVPTQTEKQHFISALRLLHVEEVQVFLERFGAAIANIEESDGYTPLMTAVVSADRARKKDYLPLWHDTVELLLKHGASPLKKTPLGLTMLSHAVHDLRLLELLLDHGADVEQMSGSFGITVLMQAAGEGCADSVVFLLARGAVIDARDEAGATALFRAVLAGHAAVASLLLDHGADGDLRDHEGKTALMRAQSATSDVASTIEVMQRWHAEKEQAQLRAGQEHAARQQQLLKQQRVVFKPKGKV